MTDIRGMAKTYTLICIDVDECCSYVPVAVRNTMEELAADYPMLFNNPNYMVVIDYDDE